MPITKSITRPLTHRLTRAINDAGAGGGVFTPDASFFAGRKGFAYDFTDPALLFQLSNGTTAVTADSDPIGYVTDLSGNGNHGTQATAGSRPLWSAADGATFDGSADVIAAGTIDFSSTDKITVIALVTASANANMGLVGLGNASAGDFGCAFYSVAGNVWAGRVYGSTANSSVQVANNAEKPTTPFTKTMSFVFDLAGAAATDEVKVRSNGYPADTSTFIAGPAGGGNFSNRAVTVGDWQGLKLNGKVARIIVIGGILTADELLAAERWVAEPSGYEVIAEIPPAGEVYYSMVNSYGQSLSAGVSTGGSVLSSSTRFNDVMPTGGVFTTTTGAALVPLVETFRNVSDSDCYETPVSGFAEMLHEQGKADPVMGVLAGFPSVTIAQCQQGQTVYNNLLTQVREGRKRARELSKHFKMRAFTWMLGESDGANGSYAANMATLVGTLNTDIKAITRQTDDVWMLSYQLDRAKIGLAQLAASDSTALIRVAMPMYFLEHYDGVHLVSDAYKVAGAYFGLAYKRLVLDGEDWHPLKCTGSSVAGTTIDLTYNAASQLVWDTTIVASQTNRGFRVVDAGLTPLTISSVTIVGTNVVRIVVASGTPAKVYVGFADPADHTANIAKTNLRDSQGDTIVFDGGGLDYPMHNWAVLQSITP